MYRIKFIFLPTGKYSEICLKKEKKYEWLMKNNRNWTKVCSPERSRNIFI